MVTDDGMISRDGVRNIMHKFCNFSSLQGSFDFF